MKTILLINDHSPGVMNAAKLAFFIAQELKADLLLADTYRLESSFSECVPEDACVQWDGSQYTNLGDYLAEWNERPNDFQPLIREMNIFGLNEKQLAQRVNQNGVWLVVKGSASGETITEQGCINFHQLLKGITCPILLVPESWVLKTPERVAYIADLRYCRSEILHYLGRLADIWHAGISIAHLSKDGLTDLADPYAAKLFDEAVRGRTDRERLSFNNIKGGDVLQATDVLINGLHHDLLAIAANRFHFNKIIGPYVSGDLPQYLPVPLLIFPS